MLTLNRQVTKLPILTLILLISFGSVCAVLYTPGLPAIANFFGVSIGQAQLTVSLFLIGYAVGQLIYGPLANRYGRKPTLYMGIGLEIVAALLCVVAAHLHWINLLLFARLLMALGASVGLKMTFTLIGDVYQGKKATQIIALLSMAFAITPGLGVSLGGYLVQNMGWQSCFYCLAAYGAVLLLFCACLPETLAKQHRQALSYSRVKSNYIKQLANKQLLCCSLMLGCGTAVVYIFAAMAPFIGMELLHLTPSQYGMYNLLPPIGMLLGSVLAMLLVNNVSVKHAIALGLVITFAGTCFMGVGGAFNIKPAILLFGSMIVVYLGLSLVFANASGLATSKAEDKAYASAMMNFINLSLSVLCVLLVGLLAQFSIAMLASIALGLTLVSAACFTVLTKQL